MSETKPILENEEVREPADPKPEHEPEADNTGVPKNFFIRCPRCRWARTSSGMTADLTDLTEINPNCVNCGRWRKFKCPKCGMPSTMRRLKGNK